MIHPTQPVRRTEGSSDELLFVVTTHSRIPLIQSFIDQAAVTGLHTACLAHPAPTASDLTLPNN
jgi:hypothetical protein